MNDYLPQFESWLKHHGYSISTCRNYLVDLGKYLNYVNHLPQTISLEINQSTSLHILSPEILGQYLNYLSDKSNSSRYLASLNRFCQFALDQHLISQNPLKKLRRQPSVQPKLNDLVSLYEQHLNRQKTSLSTRKNYINDLNQYINWLKTLNP